MNSRVIDILIRELPVAAIRSLHRFSRRVHGDERGTISIVTVFSLLMFTMLLVMIVNVATHIDDKMKMQNAADASAYSGGVVLARGMNTLAFTNHLLCDVFAMTAFLREGRDRNAEQLVPEVLDAWNVAGEKFSQSQFDKFNRLGQAILAKVPAEREAVTAYGEMAAQSAELTLGVFEYTLEERLIGKFQRTVMRTIPQLAQRATDEIAKQHGTPGQAATEQVNPRITRTIDRGDQVGVLWRTNVMRVAYSNEADPLTRTLPVVDPDPAETDFGMLPFGDQYMTTAVEQRRRLSKRFLDAWNFDRLAFFNSAGKMSNYFHLWRIATCSQLEQLLIVEYPVTNLPMVIRRHESGGDVEEIVRQTEQLLRMSRRDYQEHPTVMDAVRQQMDVDEYLEQNFQFVSAVYRRHLREAAPGLFKNPLNQNSDAVTFAQVSLFVPRPRMRRWYSYQDSQRNGNGISISLGGTYGFTSNLTVDAGSIASNNADPNSPNRPRQEHWGLENWPTHWDLLNQNWMVQLVPATASNVTRILQTSPGGELAQVRLPSFGGIGSAGFKVINHH